MQIHGKQIRNATIPAAKLNLNGFTPALDFDPVTKKFLEDNKLVIAPASAPYLQIQNGNQLYLKALAVSEVHVDSVAADLTAFVAASYTAGSEFQEGDTIILTAATGGTKIFLHNGDTTGTVADFTEIEPPAISDSYVRSLFSAGPGLMYIPESGAMLLDNAWVRNSLFFFTQGIVQDPVSGWVTADIEYIFNHIGANGLLERQEDGSRNFIVRVEAVRNIFSAGSGLLYDATFGRFSLDPNAIPSGFASESYVNQAMSSLINNVINPGLDHLQNQINALAGGSGGTGPTDEYIRGLFYGNNGVYFDSSTGEIYLDESYSRGLLYGNNGVNYNSSDGEISLDTSFVRTLFSGGTGINYSQITGQFSVNTSFMATRDYVSSQVPIVIASNPDVRDLIQMFFTTSGDLITYDSNTGVFGANMSAMYPNFNGGGILTYDGYGGFSVSETAVRSVFYAHQGISYDSEMGILSADIPFLRNAILPSPHAANKARTPLPTSGNAANTGIALSQQPKGFMIVSINGKIASIGDGVKTKHAYFSADGGTTAKAIEFLSAGDVLYWNGTIAGYQLDANDEVDMYYI